MKKRLSGKRVAASAAFRRALRRAAEFVRDPRKLNDLLDRAGRKARSRPGPLAEVRERLLAAMRLLRAYAGGRYREIPLSSLVSIVAAVIYFVVPTDMIPDFLLGFGLIDDAALIGWVVGSLQGDIDRFIEWERAREKGMPEPAPDETADSR